MSLGRVADFLAMEEVHTKNSDIEPGVAMRITDGTFFWGDPNHVEPIPGKSNNFF